MSIPTVLRMNAASCLIFGALFVIATDSVVRFVGNPPGIVLRIVGFGLLCNALCLLWSATRSAERTSLLFFAYGDGAWVAATVGLIATGTWITTGPGITASLSVAAFVGFVGLLQWRAARRMVTA
jgi:hypothetical protein